MFLLILTRREESHSVLTARCKATTKSWSCPPPRRRGRVVEEDFCNRTSAGRWTGRRYLRHVTQKIGSLTAISNSVAAWTSARWSLNVAGTARGHNQTHVNCKAKKLSRKARNRLILPTTGAGVAAVAPDLGPYLRLTIMALKDESNCTDYVAGRSTYIQ
jgi:hypothetical protein